MEKKMTVFRIMTVVLTACMMISGCGKEKVKEVQNETTIVSVADKTAKKEESDITEEISTKEEMHTEENCSIENLANETIEKEEKVEEQISEEATAAENAGEEEIKRGWNGDFNKTDEYLEAITEGTSYVGSSETTETQKMAQDIVSKIIRKEMSDFDKVKAINDYMILNVEYDGENFAKGTIPTASYTAYGAMKNKVAVCAGYAKMFNVLCDAAGLESSYVVGSARGYHAWNQVKVDGKWYNIDVTWNDPDAEENKNGHYYCGCYQYFLLSDEMMGKTHTSKSAKYNLNP